MERLEVLISGAGIAGCTLAYWLTRNGQSVTVVERSGSLRSSGSPVDVRGPAVDVAERMNIATRLREASIRLKGMTLLDSSGRRVARVDIAALRSSIVPKDMEIARGDLARILHEASANDADYIFGDSIKAVTQNEMGVDVAFERSRPRCFDLVIGADGLHSIVRRLAFGADSEFVQHAGLYAATITLPGSSDNEGEMFMLNTPGKLAALHPCQGVPLAYFVFWHPEIPEFDYTDLNQHTFLRGPSPASAGEYRSSSMRYAWRVMCTSTPSPAWMSQSGQEGGSRYSVMPHLACRCSEMDRLLPLQARMSSQRR